MQSRDEIVRQISEAVAERAARTAYDSAHVLVEPTAAAATTAPIAGAPTNVVIGNGSRHDASTEPRSAFGALAWGLLGFLIGAVFWHFIGFWSFVSEVVFVGNAVRDERLVEQSGPLCAQFVLDRSTGTISGEACPPDAPLLNEGALAVRGDFAGDRGPRPQAARPAIRLSDGSR